MKMAAASAPAAAPATAPWRPLPPAPASNRRLRGRGTSTGRMGFAQSRPAAPDDPAGKSGRSGQREQRGEIISLVGRGKGENGQRPGRQCQQGDCVHACSGRTACASAPARNGSLHQDQRHDARRQGEMDVGGWRQGLGPGQESGAGKTCQRRQCQCRQHASCLLLAGEIDHDLAGSRAT